MPNEDKQKTYPMRPNENWWRLRRALRSSTRIKLLPDDLATLLDIGVASARNLVGPLRTLGLADAEGNLTPRGLKWREDEDYP